MDLQGVMGTLRDGRRVLLCKRMALYLDKFGYPATAPPVKGILKTFIWPWKIWVDADSGLTPYEAGMSALSIDSGWTIAEEPSPPGEPSQPMSIPEPAVETIAWAKTFDDGNSLTSTLPAKKVTVGTGQFTDCIYIEEPGRSCGIRVEPNAGTFLPGDVVDVTAGTLQTTADEERFIDAATVAWVGSGTQLRPAGIRNREVGGGRFWDGTDIWQEGVVGGFGQNNIGLLAKTWGKITQQGAGYIYIDDGSGTSACEGCTQVRVETDHLAEGNSITYPMGEGFIGVTGISSCKWVNGQVVRVLRPRSQTDILGPKITITAPLPGSVTKPSGGTIPVSGTVEAGIAAITSVEVSGDGGVNWVPATVTGETWERSALSITPGQGKIIEARATDGTGLVVYAQVTVDVTEKTIIYVKPGGTGNGSSWAQAMGSVQTGLNTAVSGNEVWVAAGTYFQRITLKSGVGLYGGFFGNESYQEARKPRINVSILDGSQTGAVVQASNVSSSTVIDGFTIRNGKAPVGGGLQCSSSSLTISNNIISQNTAYDPDFGAMGGGIYCSGGSPIIEANIVKNNVAEGGYPSGGGIYCYNCIGVRASSNLIVDNQSISGIGSGIYVGNVSLASLSNNTVAGNTGEGIYCYGTPPPMTNNIVAFNTLRGVVLEGSSAPTVFSHNDVYGNTGGNYSWTPVPTGTNGNISADPSFVNRLGADYHLTTGSPCVDAGETNAVTEDLDVDGDWRVQGNSVDMGADETPGCAWHTLTVTTTPVPLGTPATITAYVFDRANRVPAGNWRVNVSVQDGTLISPSGGFGYTDSDGYFEATVGRATPGYATVTVSIDTCSTQVIRTVTAFIYDPEDDWPMFMHDPQHTGMSMALDLTSDALTLAWSAEVQTASTARSERWPSHNQPGDTAGGFIFEHPFIDSSPVVAGNKVVVGTWTRGTKYPLPGEPNPATGSVKAFNGETGALLWTATGNPAMGGVASTACIDSGRVYVGTTNGYLYCLDLASGAQLWAQPTADRSSPAGQGRIIASPAVHNGIVYIGNEAAKVYAFGAVTGDLIAGYPVVLPIGSHGITNLATQNMTGTSSPAVTTVSGTDYLLFGCDDGYLYRITLGTSDPQSTLVGVNLVYCVESSPTVAGEVYIGTSHYNGNQTYRSSVEPLQILIGANVNSPNTGQECRATLAYDGNEYLYAGLDTGYTFHKTAADTLNNAATFSLSVGHYFVGSAAICGNGLVYVGNDDGWFRALRINDLTQAAAYNGGVGFICSSPAIAYSVDANHNRWVYITTRNGNGKLLAFKTVR